MTINKISRTPGQKVTYVLLGFIAFISFVCLSPKWTMPVFAWIGPVCLLGLFRGVGVKYGIIWVFLIQLSSGLIANFGSVPFPVPVFVIIMIMASFQGLVPYLLDTYGKRYIKGWVSTLIFPSAWVLIDYFTSFGPSGVWGHLANTQYSFSLFIQWASVTGVWGISFMLYWFAPVVNDAVASYRAGNTPALSAKVYSVAISLILIFGAVRLTNSTESGAPSVKVAAITTQSLHILETTYEAAFGNTIRLSTELSQASPELAEASKATLALLSSPDESRFLPVYQAFDHQLEMYFELSEHAVRAGAQVVVWSEAAIINVKKNEPAYIEQAQAFAKRHSIYLFFPMAIMHPEAYAKGRPFMENKVLTINPMGEVVHTYLKNVPVKGIEPSIPGDGDIPIITTPYGKISPAICYDADFPSLMSQLGQKDTQLVVIPSGDWKAISPYHSYMASIRAIENGTAMVRPTSHGLHLITDAYGRVLAKDDFFEDDHHTLIVDVPIISVKTWYTTLGDVVPLVCGLVLVSLFVRGVYLFRRRTA